MNSLKRCKHTFPTESLLKRFGLQLDSNVNLSMFGWITVAYSIGQMFATWVFGYWNQRTMSVRWPACCGLAFMTFGNAIYGALSKLPVHHAWWMLFARLLVGFGSGRKFKFLKSVCIRQEENKNCFIFLRRTFTPMAAICLYS